MSVESQIQRIKEAVGSAYGVCEAKGAEMPTARNVENLANCIDSVKVGGDGHKLQIVTNTPANGDAVKGLIDGGEFVLEPNSYGANMRFTVPSCKSLKITDGGYDYGYSGWNQATLNGTSVTQGTEYVLEGDSSLSITFCQCLTGDTLVTMADGTFRRIDKINVGDMVLAYDPDTNQLVPDLVFMSDSKLWKTGDETDVWTFEDGYQVKTVKAHELYNVEKQGMKYMSEWQLGEHARTLEGKNVALVKHEVVKGRVRHFRIAGRHHNFFVNGLLNGDRYARVKL